MTAQRLSIRMSPGMCSEINRYIRSRSNVRRQFITDVSIFALAVAITFPLLLAFGDIAGSWK